MFFISFIFLLIVIVYGVVVCRRKAATDKLVEKIVKHDSWPMQPDILSPPLLRLTSRKPLWLDLQPVDIKSRWRHNWKSAQVVNSHLVCDPTIRQPGFDLPRQQWSLLNRFRTEQGHCGVCRRKWRLTDTDLCPCGETQTMSHIVESCPLTKLNGGLSRLHSADEDAVSWLTNMVNDTHRRRRSCTPFMYCWLLSLFIYLRLFLSLKINLASAMSALFLHLP